MNRFITIGKVSGVHGIKGQLKVQSYTEPSAALLNYKDLYWNYNNYWHPMPVIKNSLKANGRSFVLNIVDCHDRDGARKYQFVEIAVPKESLPKLDPILNQGQHYWADLEGLKVYSIYGSGTSDNSNNTEINIDIKQCHYLGVIDHIIATGSNDVLIVKEIRDNKDNKDNKEHLIPYLFGKYVLSVDLEAGSMIVDWDPEF